MLAVHGDRVNKGFEAGRAPRTPGIGPKKKTLAFVLDFLNSSFSVRGAHMIRCHELLFFRASSYQHTGSPPQLLAGVCGPPCSLLLYRTLRFYLTPYFLPPCLGCTTPRPSTQYLGYPPPALPGRLYRILQADLPPAGSSRLFNKCFELESPIVCVDAVCVRLPLAVPSLRRCAYKLLRVQRNLACGSDHCHSTRWHIILSLRLPASRIGH